MKHRKSLPATPDLIDKTTGGGLVIDQDWSDPQNINAAFDEHGLDPERIVDDGSDGTNRY